MKRLSWWVFLGAVILGIPALLIDSWKSPIHEICFKIYMAVAVIWNVVFILYKLRQNKRDLAIAILKMPQEASEAKVEPCWKSCVYKYVHGERKGIK